MARDFAVVLVVNGYGEEVGWRGFAWTRLRKRHTSAGAALILGLVWAAWHTPLFWIDSAYADFKPALIPMWLISFPALALVMGWLYERARSSIFVVALFHTSLNMATATEGTEGLISSLVSAAVIFWAVLIVRSNKTLHRQTARNMPAPGLEPAASIGRR